jgi:hypothetical protein
MPMSVPKDECIGLLILAGQGPSSFISTDYFPPIKKNKSE